MKTLLRISAGILLTLQSLQVQGYMSLNFNKPNSNNWDVYGKGNLSNVQMLVSPNGIYSEVSITAEISAHGVVNATEKDTLEAVLYFDLPDKSLVVDSWLWMEDNSIVRADHYVRSTATNIYENIVKRIRRDPSILTKSYGNTYELKIYPFYGFQKRKFKITYLTPMKWENGKQLVELPLDLLKLSNTIPGVQLSVFENNNFNVSKLKMFPNKVFVTTNVGENTMKYTYITANQVENYFPNYFSEYYTSNYVTKNSNPCLLELNTNQTNGKHFTYYKTSSNSGYFELSISPSLAANLKITKRICFVIDHFMTCSGINIENIHKGIKNLFSSRLDSNYFFNVIYHQNTAHSYSNVWLKATPKNIDLAFADTSKFNSDTLNMEKIITKAVDFVNYCDSSARIVLITSNNLKYSFDSTSKIVGRIHKKMTKTTPIDVIDNYVFKNYGYYYDINGIYRTAYYYFNGNSYYGNEYFYSQLNRKSLGSFYNTRPNYGYFYSYSSLENQNSNLQLNKHFETISENLSGKYDAIELQVNPENGFTHSKYVLQGDISMQNYVATKPITMIGKYVGNFPFQIKLMSIYNNVPALKTFEVTETEAEASGQSLETHWYGNYIEKLENNHSKESVEEIIELALEKRILSKYTAFLALEPSMGGTICSTCQENTPIKVNFDASSINVNLTNFKENEATKETEMTVNIYPNPASEKVTFQLNNTKNESIKIEVFNTSGVLLYSLTTHETSFEWNLNKQNGLKLETGIYFVVITSDKMVVNKKLIIH